MTERNRGKAGELRMITRENRDDGSYLLSLQVTAGRCRLDATCAIKPPTIHRPTHQ